MQGPSGINRLMKKLPVLLCSACLLMTVFVTILPAQVRTWTDRKGSTLRAEYMSVAGETIWLRKTDGSRMKVPWQNLSDHDQEWVDGMLKASGSSLEAMGLSLTKNQPVAATPSTTPAASVPGPASVEPTQPAGEVNLQTGYKDTYGLPDAPAEQQQQAASAEAAAEPAEADGETGASLKAQTLIIAGGAAGAVLLIIIIAVASSSRKKR